jgi:hypothetical protein
MRHSLPSPFDGRKAFAPADTGVAPEATFAELRRAHKEKRPEPLPEQLPESLVKVVFHCLEKAPEERFQNVQDLEKALDACKVSPPWTDEDAAAWWRPGWLLPPVLNAVGKPQPRQLRDGGTPNASVRVRAGVSNSCDHRYQRSVPFGTVCFGCSAIRDRHKA